MARIALVKPEKARAIEDMIIGAARRGALKEKVSEDSLIGLLEQVGCLLGTRWQCAVLVASERVV